MATWLLKYDVHNHAGARWLASAGVPFVLALLTGFLMLAYPHL